MKIQEFEEAIRKDDFSIGDSFWLGDWEFEVVSRRGGSKCVCADDVVYKWQLTAQDFIQLIGDNHPEIDNAEAFFDEHKDKIAHHFAEGLLL